ncbi:MAG: hypothetical protein E6G35_05415 [Actinobacteria bacterium]|nr:MAG: hypothetical protein E6G35_05415 [Actinomycetota bacterium]
MDPGLDIPEPHEATEVRTVPWWVGPAFGLLALGTVPWVIFLAVTLPHHATFAHYRAVWVGFDSGLIAVLALTALLAWWARPEVALTSTAAATMLLVDAWFDVMTTPARHGLLMAVVLAVLVELPLAGICLWIARHAEQVMEYRVMVLVRRARRVERRLARRTVIERAKP